MAIREIRVEGYRSVRELEMKLSPINVLTGPNGCGKSNLYNSLLILARASQGQFARAIAEEGGTPSVFWAGGERVRYSRKKPPKRVILAFDSEDFGYELQFGIPSPNSHPPGGTMLTWAKPAGQPFDCNGCVPLIAAGIFINGPNGWQAESVNRAAISYGNFGKPPEGRLVEIGPGHRAFLLHLTSTTEATTESEALLVPWKGSVVEAMRIVMADSNDGNCGGAYPCYKNQRELKFVPGSNPDYNDIVLTLSGTDMPPNPPYKVHDVRGTQRLRFQEGKYVPIEKSGDTISAEARK